MREMEIDSKITPPMLPHLNPNFQRVSKSLRIFRDVVSYAQKVTTGSAIVLSILILSSQIGNAVIAGVTIMVPVIT